MEIEPSKEGDRIYEACMVIQGTTIPNLMIEVAGIIICIFPRICYGHDLHGPGCGPAANIRQCNHPQAEKRDQDLFDITYSESFLQKVVSWCLSGSPGFLYFHDDHAHLYCERTGRHPSKTGTGQ